MSDVRDEGAVPDAVTAPPRHPNSTVEPHSEAAKPSTHLDSQFLQDGNGGNGGDAREVAENRSGDSERTVLLEPVDPVEVERNDGPSPEVADVQLEHAGPVVQEHLVEHEPQSLLASDATPAREPVQQEAGRLAPGTDEQTLLGPPSPNLYGEPTPPARTVDLPAAPLLSPDLDLPAPVSQAPVPSLAPASPRNLHIRTQPADLIATPRELNSTTPSGSVPSTPISPSGGDAGHDGSTEDNDEDDERPLWDRLAAGQQRGRGEDYRPEAGPMHDGRYEGNSPVVETPRESTDESDRAVRSEESDAVEALDPSAIASSRARPPSASQPPPFVAPPRFTDGASQELPSTSFPPNGRAGNGARPHGRSQSVALPTSGPTSPGGSPFQSTLSSALGPPSHRTSEHRYRASSAVAGAVAPATNGVSASRSPSTGTAPSSSLAREASLRASSRADSGSQPPSRQASISADGRHVPASEGQVSRSASRRTAPSSAAAGEGSSHTVVHGARSRRTLGEWQLTKTLGAGSMGKVKLGVSQVTGEKVAIKIIPRFTSTASAHRQAEQSQQPQSADAGTPAPSSKKPDPTASFIAKAAAKDASKEIRTVREGSLCLLLHHPYICGMREMLVYPHHYYFVQEYVNGGQMLDYIIAHGRLRERSARKFARQIGSALEYCHANSIVHRDLKIENILISKTGNIKIIDFGLSNLYSPASHLSTFCGSLYFAAPELLNAKPYTGPEVDVWSFGIVLYVLVCGKVPFDDQSMPALHAKIKRGQVEYPAWLSSECKHLLSRMLVTVPSQRATLQEVLNHPWVVKGFPSAPAAHIPTRAPLRLGELDADVIRGMTGFEFGTEEEIGAKLAEVIQSDSYRQAVRNWESKRNAYGFGGAADAGSASDSDRERPAMRTDGKDMRRSPSSKRFSGLGFYGKKLAGGFNAAFAGASAPAPKAYNELEPGAAASSETTFVVNGVALRPESLDPTRGFHPLLSIYYLVKEKIDRERIWGPGVFASSTLSLTGPPPPPAPAQAYATGSPHVTTPVSLDARPAMPTPPMPITPQPRQRAMGDFATMPASAPARPNEFSSTNKRASYFGQTASPASPAIPSFRPPAEYEMPGSPTPRERKASNRMSLMLGSSTSERDRASEQPNGLAVPNDDVPLATISQSASSPGGFARRFSSLLGKSSPDANGYKGHRTRASIATTGHKSTTKTAASPLPQVAEGEPVGALRPPLPTRLPSSGSDVPLASPPAGKPVARASTMGEISPSRHLRGVSMAVPPSAAATGASPLSQSVGTDASADSSRTASRERRRQGDMFDDLEEEELAAPTGPTGAGEAAQPASAAADEGQTASVRSGKHDKSESAKPVWLKGLFSVSTTSTKPIATLRADLVRVLDRLGVQHRDVKNGYECAHVPSIDLSSFGGANESASAKDKRGGTVRRRASKLLLPTNRASEAGDSSHSLPPTSPIEGRNGNSFAGGVPASSRTDADGNGSANPAAKADMIVRFEIFLVKMPLLPGIHGLQFRRIGGDAWQYQMLARRVLQELKL